MGTVYLGRSPAGRRVAVKIVRAELADDPEYRARFRREAEVARRVARYCTAEVLDAVDPPDGAPYLVTEFVDGPPLSETVSRRGPLGSADVERVAVSVASALTVIHAAGLVHRDLKPSNVLLSQFGPRVIDFGVAWAPDSVTVTRDLVVGTPAFMAPEQARGERVTSAADIFSWGGLIIFAATGRRPFGGGAVPAVLYRIVNSDPDLTGLDEDLIDVVRAAMHRDPAERPTAPEIVGRLQTLSTVRATPPSWFTAPVGDPAATSLTAASTDSAANGAAASGATKNGVTKNGAAKDDSAPDSGAAASATPVGDGPAGGSDGAVALSDGVKAAAAGETAADEAGEGPSNGVAAKAPAADGSTGDRDAVAADVAADADAGAEKSGDDQRSGAGTPVDEAAGAGAVALDGAAVAGDVPADGGQAADGPAGTGQAGTDQAGTAGLGSAGAESSGDEPGAGEPGSPIPNAGPAEPGDGGGPGGTAAASGSAGTAVALAEADEHEDEDDPTVGTGPVEVGDLGDDFTFSDLAVWDGDGSDLTVGYLARLDSVDDDSGDPRFRHLDFDDLDLDDLDHADLDHAELDHPGLADGSDGVDRVSQRTVTLRGGSSDGRGRTQETLALGGVDGDSSGRSAWPPPRANGRLGVLSRWTHRMAPGGRIPWTTLISAFSVLVALAAVGVAAAAALDSGPAKPTSATLAAQLIIPDHLVGLTAKEAQARLHAAGVAHWRFELKADLQPKGTVLEVQPGEGIAIEASDTVTLVVSAGMNSVKIPQVVGLTDSAARSNLQDAGLTVVVRSITGPANVDPGHVAAIIPMAGVEVPPGSSVTIVVVVPAGTRSLAAVPFVVGKTINDAQNALHRAGFTDVAIAYAPASEPAGVVTATDPAANTMAAKNATVTLTVSTGPGQTAVPDVAGKTQADAEAALAGAGLVANVKQDTGPSTITAGLVASVDPAAGTTVGLHATVTITVVSAQVSMPDTRGSQRADAERVLSSYGLTVVVTQQSSNAAVGSVLTQSAAPGAMVPRGSTVRLVVAKAPDPPPSGGSPTTGAPTPPTSPPTSESASPPPASTTG